VIYTLLPRLGGQQVFVTAVAVPVKGCCDMSRSPRAYVYLDMLIDANTGAEKTGKVDMSVMAEYIVKWGGLAECKKDNVVKGKYYMYPPIPELTSCEVCYNEVVEPNEQEVAMAKGWVLKQGDHQCTLYSPRTRETWATAADNEDEAGLRQKVLSRKAKHEEVLGTLDGLKMELQQAQEEVKTYQQLAQMEQASTMSTVLAVQIGTGHIPVVSFFDMKTRRKLPVLTILQPTFERSRTLMQQAVQASMRADATQRQIDLLVKQWTQNFE